jgi:D-threo-aldose 1-dehydrogenase
MSYDPAATRQIGRTKLRVSQLGFGTAPFGNLMAEVTDAAAHEAVTAARAGGISYFDTAPFYGHGLSEHRLGAAIRAGGRDGAVLSTKVGRLLRPTRAEVRTPGTFNGVLPFELAYDYGYDGAMRSLEDSLQRMGTSHVDIALIHDVTRKWRGDDFDASYRQAVDGAYKALDKLRSEGVVSAIGVGINEVDTLERFARDADFDCFMLAGRYTLIDTTALPTLLPLCEQKNISILLAAPFHSGILVTGARPGAKFWYADAPAETLAHVAHIERICAAHGVSLQAAAVQFPLAHPALASVPAGYRSAAEVEAALAACRARIPANFWAEMKHEGLIDPAAPTPHGD